MVADVLSRGYHSMFQELDSKLPQMVKDTLKSNINSRCGLGLKTTKNFTVSQVLKETYKRGLIDDKQSTVRFLSDVAKKTSEPEKIEDIVNHHKESIPEKKAGLIGREDDVKKITDSLKNRNVSGINLYGPSGVGKTKLAVEVSKHFKEFNPLPTVDLRNIVDMGTVYSLTLISARLRCWDPTRDKIKEYLNEKLKEKILVIFDNVEQLLKDSEKNKELTEFFQTVLESRACKNNLLKFIITSQCQVGDLSLKEAGITEYEVKPLDKKVSKEFIVRSSRGKDLEVLQEEDDRDLQSCDPSEISEAKQVGREAFKEPIIRSTRLKHILEVPEEDEDKILVKISELCRNIPYLLQGAERLMRVNYCTPTQVLKKITTQIDKGVPERFACISALFEGIAMIELKQVAVKISLLRRPFSASTAMKIAEIPSDYDARWDLDMLVNHKIITAEDVDGKRKYDLHELFREFVKSHLCEEDPFYDQQLQRGKKQFFKHFSGKLTKLAQSMETDFVKTYSKLEVNKANFELTFDISQESKETFHLLLHSGKLEKFALMGIMFEVLKERHERRELYANWAEAAENQEQWLASALMRCWQSIQHTSGMGETKQAQSTLEKAIESIKKAEQTASAEQLIEVKSLYLQCSGKIKYLCSQTLTPEESKKKAGKRLLKDGINDLENSISMREQFMGDNTLTSRALNLIGNCYLQCEQPEKALIYYQRAIDMKKRLVGPEGEDNWEFSTFYNQIAQVHERIGREQEEKWYNIFFGFKKKARIEYEEAAKWMEKSLELQEKLELSVTEYTALFQRNLANILLSLKEYDKALEYAKKSSETRYNILKEHPDTVRSLYLIGIIHEWRKDHEAALQSYEEAFTMEESLPEDNHSIVRKKIRDRLAEMCKKLKYNDKLKEFKMRVKEIEEKAKVQIAQAGPTNLQQPIEPPSDNTQPNEIEINVYRNGGYYNHSSYGHFLYFPPNTVTEPSKVKCKVLDAHSILSPVRFAETLSSYILELGPSSVHLRNPVIITMLHSGPGTKYGYETIVRSFDAFDKKWQEIEVLKEDSHAPQYCTCHYLQVRLQKLSTLAVITRLITERCQVTSKGCIVRSSVCKDVTVEFPEGAIADKKINGEIQVLPTNGSAINDNIVPCPAVLFHGFQGVMFSKSVKIKVPFPSSVVKSTPRLFRWDFHDGQSDQWKSITDFQVENGFIEFVVDHFSLFWPLTTLNVSAKYVKDSIISCWECWFNPANDVSFAAYMQSEQVGDEIDLQLTCVALHEQEALTEKMEKKFKYLVHSTGDKPMKYRDKAYPDVQDCTPLDRNFFLEYLGEGKECSKQFVVNTTSDRILLQYYNNVTERNVSNRLCRLRLKTNSENNNVDSSDVIEYFGVLIDELCDTPEDVVMGLPKYCKNFVFSDWNKTGAKMFYSNLPKDNPDCFQDLLNSLSKFDGARHLANYLNKGHRLVTAPLKTLRDDIKENVIDIVARNVDCYYGLKLVNYLGVSKDFVDECRKKYPGHEQVSQTIKEWMYFSDNGTVEDLFKALKYLKMRNAAVELATFTTKISKQEDYL